MMKRGTTPTHTFTLPFDVSMIQKLRVLYSQDGELKLTKTEATMEGNTVSVKLTQADTFILKCGRFVDIQLRILTPAGDALNSDVIRVAVDRCLEEDELV